MALTIIAENTRAATVGTEHTLATDTTGKTYLLVVDTSNMVLGDEVELRCYTKVRSTSSEFIASFAAFAHAQSEPNKYSIPIAADVSFKATLKQTAGTSRNFDWKILAI